MALNDSTLVVLSDISTNLGVNLFEEDIDNVVFKTNEFLTNDQMTGANGPFWWILQMSMALGALFAFLLAAGQAYKMMSKGEVFDVMKILKILAVAMVMCLWYDGVLDGLAYIPNRIGSWTHDMYDAERMVVEGKIENSLQLYAMRDSLYNNKAAPVKAAEENMKGIGSQEGVIEAAGAEEVVKNQEDVAKKSLLTAYAGFMVGLDKIVMFFSFVLYRIGWWATIYGQQILLGMLTIFGPIQWAFSLLPKWEGAWAKWIIRYLTVHFYGAMLYFVGFYVLLLWDIVLSIQIENLEVITQESGAIDSYIQNAFMTAGYLLAASIVSIRCLNFVPDLASWMVPEGDTAFSTRSFGEGVSSGMKASATSLIRF